jgi:hypothetical protein
MVFRRRPPRSTTLAGRKTRSSTHHHHRRPPRPTTPTTPSKPPPLHANCQHRPILFRVRHHTSAQGEAADAVRPRTLHHGGRRLHAPHRTPPLRWSSIPARTVETPPPPSPPTPFGSPGPPRKSGGAEKTPPSCAAHRREANVDAACRTNAPPMRESPVPSFSDVDPTAMATDMLPSLTEMPPRHGS